MTHGLKIFVLFAVLTIFAGSLAAQTPAPPSARGNLVETRSPASPGCSALALAGSGDPSQSPAAAKGQLDLSALDKSVSPCANFFNFSTGNWAKNNPIPADYASWGISEKLDHSNKETLRAILEKAAADKNATPDSPWQKIGDYYGSCMDESAIESARAKPLESEFAHIAAISDLGSFQAELARLHTFGVNAVFGFGADQDFKDSTQEIAEIGQGGLGLPDRDYYTRDDDKSKELRENYVKHVAKMFQRLGNDPAKSAAEAKAVLEIETRLAGVSLAVVDLRDPDKVYHRQTVAELSASTPHFRWPEYFEAAGAKPPASLNVAEPDFFKGMDAALASVPLDDWKTYLRWHLIHVTAASLSKDFVSENFDFYGRTLTGSKQEKPRGK